MYRLISVLLLLAGSAHGQTYFEHLKESALSVGFSTLSGVGDGAADALKHHYSQTWLPQSGRGNQFWNPAISWQNKYANWPTDQSAAFPGSKTALVFVTDGWHLFKFVRNKSAVAAVVSYKRPNKRLWFVYDFLVHSAAFSVGWHIGDKLLKL